MNTNDIQQLKDDLGRTGSYAAVARERGVTTTWIRTLSRENIDHDWLRSVINKHWHKWEMCQGSCGRSFTQTDHWGNGYCRKCHRREYKKEKRE